MKTTMAKDVNICFFQSEANEKSTIGRMTHINWIKEPLINDEDIMFVEATNKNYKDKRFEGWNTWTGKIVLMVRLESSKKEV